jgi:hypothetical protein
MNIRCDTFVDRTALNSLVLGTQLKLYRAMVGRNAQRSREMTFLRKSVLGAAISAGVAALFFTSASAAVRLRWSGLLAQP